MRAHAPCRSPIRAPRHGGSSPMRRNRRSFACGSPMCRGGMRRSTAGRSRFIRGRMASCSKHTSRPAATWHRAQLLACGIHRRPCRRGRRRLRIRVDVIDRRAARRRSPPTSEGQDVTEPAGGGSARDGLCVIVVSYGSPTLLAEALRGLEGAYPTIVVDNLLVRDAEAVAEQAGARYVDPGDNLGIRPSGEPGTGAAGTGGRRCPAVESRRFDLPPGNRGSAGRPAGRSPGRMRGTGAAHPGVRPVEPGVVAVAHPGGSVGGSGRASTAALDPRFHGRRHPAHRAGPPWPRSVHWTSASSCTARTRTGNGGRSKKVGASTYCSDVMALHRGGRTDTDLERLQTAPAQRHRAVHQEVVRAPRLGRLPVGHPSRLRAPGCRSTAVLDARRSPVSPVSTSPAPTAQLVAAAPLPPSGP